MQLSVNYITVSADASKTTAYIYIYDGNSTRAPLIAFLSGTFSTPLPSYISSQQYMIVRFMSNQTTVYQGFNMSYASTAQGERDVASICHDPVNIMSSGTNNATE